MPSQVLIAGTGSNVSVTGRAWIAPGNITSNDGTSSTQGGLRFATATTDVLRASNFGFTIPIGANILGIVATIELSASSNTTNFAIDSSVQLTKAGTAVGNDLATASILPVSVTALDFGGIANLWGTTWTASDVNDSGFGVQFQAEINRDAGGSCTVSVDYIELTVYYAEGRSMLAEHDQIDVTFENAALSHGYEFDAVTNPLSVAGAPGMLKYSRRFVVNTDTFAVTPPNGALSKGYRVLTTARAYTITSINAEFLRSFIFTVSTTSVVVSSPSPALFKYALLRPLSESFPVSVYDSGLYRSWLFSVASHGIVHTGVDATLHAETSLSTDLFSATFFTPIEVDAVSRPYVIDAPETLLIYPRQIEVDVEAFDVTGYQISPRATRLLSVGMGQYTHALQDAILFKGYVLQADSLAVNVIGNDADKLHNRRLSAEMGSYTCSSYQVVFVYFRVLVTVGGIYTAGPNTALVVWSRGIQADLSVSHWSLTSIDTAHRSHSVVKVKHGPAFTVKTKNYIVE